ncbi:MAG: hypothetical protein ABI780_07545 [Ardenticatenales bacterium]
MASLLLSAPGGSLIAEATPDLRAFFDAERSALAADAIRDTAKRLGDEIPDARRVDWNDVAHLPSMERPDDFLALLRDWLGPRAGHGWET